MRRKGILYAIKFSQLGAILLFIFLATKGIHDLVVYIAILLAILILPDVLGWVVFRRNAYSGFFKYSLAEITFSIFALLSAAIAMDERYSLFGIALFLGMLIMSYICFIRSLRFLKLSESM